MFPNELPLLQAKQGMIHPEFDEIQTIGCRRCDDKPVVVSFCNSRDTVVIQCANCKEVLMFLAVASRIERYASREASKRFFGLLNAIRNRKPKE